VAQRGRPKKEGELKETSVRIRPALREKLALAAQDSGESLARELEERLEATFTEVPMRQPTRDLLREIALAAKAIEQETGKLWDKDLTAWAMLREVMANGPIANTIPHPDAAATRNAIAANAELAELTAERNAMAKLLMVCGVNINAGAVLGGKALGIPPQGLEGERETLASRQDIPEDMRDTLLEQLDRIREIDPQIAELQKQVNEAMAPYFKARRDARDRLYRTQGVPDLPTWLTAPVGSNEPPPSRGGMFGR
jgi:hypothetical protein